MWNKIENVLKDSRKRKPYVAAVLLSVLFVWEIFWFSPFLSTYLGIVGVILHEVVLAGIGVGVFVVFRGKMKIIFPFKDLRGDYAIGTILMWIGAYQIVMALSYFMSIFFPEEIEQAGESVNSLVNMLPVSVGLFVVALVPAVCEEIAFRGALLSCFRHIKNRWIGIVIVALLFGACHGSIWRMLPTAILGAFMGYILFETENMFYNMLFHFINNAFPVILLGITRMLTPFAGIESEMNGLISSDGYTRMMTEAFAGAVKMAAIAPLLIYVGNYMLHRGTEAYANGLFSEAKRDVLVKAFIASVTLWGTGTAMQFILYFI